MSRIKHPQPQVGIVVDDLGGIEFTDGFAEVDLTDKPNLREAYLQHGYGITDPLRAVDGAGDPMVGATVTMVRSESETPSGVFLTNLPVISGVAPNVVVDDSGLRRVTARLPRKKG
jgi:hypothetical protein